MKNELLSKILQPLENYYHNTSLKERAIIFYVKKEIDTIAMMKPREELLQGYIYLSTKFHKCGTITKDFRDRVKLNPSARNSLKNPSP